MMTHFLRIGLALSVIFLALSVAAASQDDERELYEQLTLFGDVLEQVRRNYVDAPSDKELIEAALSGMMSSLDPHSSYMPPKNFEDMQVETKGEFGGLGIEVTMENGLVKVIAPIDDTPASRALGMRPNDLIAELDGKPIMGLTLSEAVELMRGKKGTPITLTVLREGEDEPLEIRIVRDIIRIRAVRTRVEGPDKNIAYIRLTTFNQQTTKSLKEAFNKLPAEIGSQNLAGYIIDLRTIRVGSCAKPFPYPIPCWTAAKSSRPEAAMTMTVRAFRPAVVTWRRVCRLS